jgi:hypothetical protein
VLNCFRNICVSFACKVSILVQTVWRDCLYNVLSTLNEIGCIVGGPAFGGTAGGKAVGGAAGSTLVTPAVATSAAPTEAVGAATAPALSPPESVIAAAHLTTGGAGAAVGGALPVAACNTFNGEGTEIEPRIVQLSLASILVARLWLADPGQHCQTVSSIMAGPIVAGSILAGRFWLARLWPGQLRQPSMLSTMMEERHTR